MLLCSSGDETKIQEIFNLSYRIVSLIGAWKLIYFIVHVALLLGDESKIQNWATEMFRSMRGESLCVSIVHAALPIGGSIQASRHIQTELQNCFAYWGVKAHIIYNACCSASWEMNPRGAKGHQILFGNPIPISYSDILFRNPIPKSYGEILLQTSL